MRSQAPALLPVFRSAAQARILAQLVLHPEQEASLSSLSRTLEIPATTVQDEVTRLLEAGILRDRRVGRSRIVSMDQESRLVPALSELVTLAYGPESIIADEFAELEGVDRLVIYGSWARRYHGERGLQPQDVDVLVVGEVDREEAYEAADRAEDRIGFPVNVTLRSTSAWSDASDALIAEIKRRPLVEVTPS